MSTIYGLRAASVCLLLSGTVCAETLLPPILISAARTAQPGIDIPAARSVIDAQAIADSGARNLDQLLRRLPALHVSDGLGDGSGSRIDLRGFGATAQSNVVILVNGRKLNPATDSATLYLNSIDLDNVERIEVIEGSAGTLYGNQAVGGLVNIVTRRPTSRSRTIAVGGGSYNTGELSAAISEPLTDDAIARLAVEHRRSDNYRDRNNSRTTRLSARVDFDHAAGSSYVDLMRLDDYLQTPGALFAAELAADRRQAVFPNDYLDTRSTVLRVGTRQALGEHWRAEGELTLGDDEREFVQSFRGFPGTRSTQDRDSVELTPRLIGDFGESVWTLGIDYLDTDYLLVSAFGPQGNEQTISAAYAQLTQHLSPALSLTAGVRHARVSNDINNNRTPLAIDNDVTVGSLGAVFRPDPAWRLFLRADQNYRFAKVDEHTNVPFGQPAGIDDQHGISYETGIEYDSDGVRLAARTYLLELRDEISFDAGTGANVNLDRSRRRGGTVSADLGLARGIRAGIAYTFTDSEITDGPHKGSDVPLVPRHRATAYVDFKPCNDCTGRIDIERVGSQYLGADFDNSSPPLDAYTVVNLVGHRDLGNWRFTLKVNNLLNERYIETGASSFFGDGFNPAPERALWFGARYRFEE